MSKKNIMSVINANSERVTLIRFKDLTIEEIKLIYDEGDDDATVYKEDYKQVSRLYNYKVEGAYLRYARISFPGKPDVFGRVLVPIKDVAPTAPLWSILFCPPGKITDTGDSEFCETDKELEISLHKEKVPHNV